MLTNRHLGLARTWPAKEGASLIATARKQWGDEAPLAVAQLLMLLVVQARSARLGLLRAHPYSMHPTPGIDFRAARRRQCCAKYPFLPVP